ncbi:unnamed protein product [Thlaspi arvense]|uniref:Uncharacterized protein n=1 Tax=Thlaspi arvense TaxID=13288 RepID=A0AAU9SPZ5_THLAR|nr:unnamed protein product [Thlaspi arvense]
MSTRPELLAPPEIFYNESEARKYTSSSRIVEIQARLSERALELLALPEDGVPRLLLDIGCGSGLSGETLSESGHQWIGLDISASMLNLYAHGLGIRAGVIDGAISISAVQWLCNADKSSHEPRLRLKAFFGSLYRSLSRGARAVFQVYPENIAQRELILRQALQAGFGGGLVVDYPHSTKKRKEFLVLTCGSVPTSINEGYKESGSEDDDSEDEDNGMVGVSDRSRPRKKQRTNKKGKGREWVLRKKEQSRRKGNDVPADSKYTARKRKSLCDQKDNNNVLFNTNGMMYLPRQGKTAKKKEHCVICFDDIDSDLMFYAVSCGHRFCSECVKRHIEVKLVDGEIPNCPQHRCKSLLSIDDCDELLNPKLSLMWMPKIDESSVPLTDRVYCPYQTCSYLMSKTELSLSLYAEKSSGRRRCFKCGGDFCVHCQVPWHSELSCDEYKKLHPNPQESDDAKLRSLANLNKWRQCPKCQHMVGRSYGCIRITCRCGTAFCYACGSEWRSGFHSDCVYCNQYGGSLAGFITVLFLTLLAGSVLYFLGA